MLRPPAADMQYGTVPETVAEIHNRVVKRAVTEIVYPTLLAGGDSTAVLVLLESVVAGVLAATVLLGGDEVVIDVLQSRVRRRMAEMRLADLAGIGGAPCRRSESAPWPSLRRSAP